VPPLGKEEVEKIIESANGYTDYDYPDTPENIMKPRLFSSTSECLKFFDNYYYKCISGGTVCVFRRDRDIAENLNKSNFAEAHANKKLEIQGMKNPISAALYWFGQTHENYERAIYDPNPDYKHRENEINLWKGYAFNPESNGMAKSYLDFMYETVCNGKSELYEYLLDVMARIIQRPHTKTGSNISVACRGQQGVGKSFFIENFGALFGNGYILVDNVDQITGKFNSFLFNKILVFGDEALWGGDRASGNILKSLISSGTLNIEQKFKDSFIANNYCRFFFATNGDWVAPVERGNRRFFVLDVNDSHRLDNPYFSSIKQDLDNGGYADLLNILMIRNISGRDFEKTLPKTEAMIENLLNGMIPIEQWLYEELTHPEALLHYIDDENGVSTQTLHSDFMEWAKKNDCYKTPLARFVFQLKKMLPSINPMRTQICGKRGSRVEVPCLDTLRKDFGSYLGEDIMVDVEDLGNIMQ